MTKKLKILLITVMGLIAVICASLAAGCNFGMTVDEIKDKFNLTAQVTYFLNLDGGNGGAFNDGLYIKNIYYQEGEVPLNLDGVTPTTSGSSALKLNEGFNFSGWYRVELKDGKPLYADGTVFDEADTETYDANKGMMQSDDPFDFTKPLEKDEHVYICGGFFEDVKLRLKLLYEDEPFDLQVTVKDENGADVKKTIEEGEFIDGLSYNIPKKNTGLSDITNIISIKDCTVTGLFESDDEEKDFAQRTFTPFTSWPITYPEPDENGDYSDVVLYVKVLKGNYTLLRTPTDVRSMFARGTSNKYYLMNDIDGGGLQISNLASFSGEIYGGKDGRTVKNFVVAGSSALGNGSRVAMFGEIRSGAKFKNVSFEDMTVKFTVDGNSIRQVDASVNFIAYSIQDGVTFENFSVSGSLEIKLSHETNSLVTSTTEDSWLFGDKDDATYKEITVPHATCTIKKPSGATETFTVNNIITEDLQ